MVIVQVGVPSTQVWIVHTQITSTSVVRHVRLPPQKPQPLQLPLPLQQRPLHPPLPLQRPLL